MQHYKYENGKYSFISDDGEELFTTDKIGLSYSYSDNDHPIKGTLLNHGPENSVGTLHQVRLKAYSDKLPELAGELYLFSGDIDIDELNKVINITGYVGKFHEKLIDNGVIL